MFCWGVLQRSACHKTWHDIPTQQAVLEEFAHLVRIDDDRGALGAKPADVAADDEAVGDLLPTACGNQVLLVALLQGAVVAARAPAGLALKVLVDALARGGDVNLRSFRDRFWFWFGLSGSGSVRRFQGNFIIQRPLLPQTSPSMALLYSLSFPSSFSSLSSPRSLRMIAWVVPARHSSAAPTGCLPASPPGRRPDRRRSRWWGASAASWR